MDEKYARDFCRFFNKICDFCDEAFCVVKSAKEEKEKRKKSPKKRYKTLSFGHTVQVKQDESAMEKRISKK